MHIMGFDVGDDAVKIKAMERLKATDQLCHRWAREVMDWNPRKTSSTFRAMQAKAGISLTPGFPPEIGIDVAALAKILAECKASEEKRWYYAMVHTHYCTGGSMRQKAARLHIGRTMFYQLLRETWCYLKGRLQGVGIEV